MRYLLMIYADEAAFADLDPEQLSASMKQYTAYSDWLREKGWMRAGDQLADTSQATTIRQGEGKALVIDGPFAETKEQLGGYYIVECANLDEAIEAATRSPAVAAGGSVEVRPLIDM